MKNLNSDHPFREKVILMTVRVLGFQIEEFNQIPEHLISMYDHSKYIDIARPLMTRDYASGRYSYGQLAIKYGLTERQVEYHFCCAPNYSHKNNSENEE